MAHFSTTKLMRHEQASCAGSPAAKLHLADFVAPLGRAGPRPCCCVCSCGGLCSEQNQGRVKTDTWRRAKIFQLVGAEMTHIQGTWASACRGEPSTNRAAGSISQSLSRCAVWIWQESRRSTLPQVNPPFPQSLPGGVGPLVQPSSA